MKKLFAILLALAILFSFAACGEDTQQETTEATTETTIQPTEPKELTEEEKILAARRDLVEQKMRESVTFLWRAGEDITYTVDDTTFYVEAGKLYSGVPYAFGAGTVNDMLEFAGEPDENGIYTISGLTAEAMRSGSGHCRIGNDCSSAVLLAWSYISDTCTAGRSRMMHQKYGVYPVGDYMLDVEGDEMLITGETILANGKDAIYKAYTQVQKGDAIVCHNGQKNHARMVVDVSVEYNEDGTINPAKSYISTLEQSRTFFGNTYESEELGETVHVIGGVDTKYPFNVLVRDNYIPLTCTELRDASVELAEPELTDSETQLTKDTIFTGTITCNRKMDMMTMTISDAEGNIIQQEKVFHPDRYTVERKFELQQFVTDLPEISVGSVDIAALASGNYHCTVLCRLTTGEELVARDFDFAV